MNANEIKAEIVRLGLSQKKVAAAMGIRPETLSRLLRHEVRPSDADRIMSAVKQIENDR